MRAMSEAPAGASIDEELPNILYSPSGSATTGLSGGSSLGLQYKGAWCTPPRVFVDYQVFSIFTLFSFWEKVKVSIKIYYLGSQNIHLIYSLKYFIPRLLNKR
jgi:hypothetical protein